MPDDIYGPPIAVLKMRIGGSLSVRHGWALHVTREPSVPDLEKIIAFLRERQDAMEPKLPFNNA